MEKAARQPINLKKIVEFLDGMVDRIILFAFIVATLLGFYYTYDAYMVYNGANDNSLMRYKPGAAEAVDMRELSDDVVAWLTLDDTNIDYPVMQGETNEEYLNKDPYGKFSFSGSIFLDSRNSADFSDDYSLTYGHHMSHGLMFGDLDRFLDKEYFNEHSTGTLTVKDGLVYEIHLFAAMTTQTDVRVIFAPTEEPGLMPYLRSYSDIFSEPASEHILGLSTCKTPDSIDRTCVFGYLVPIEGADSGEKFEKKEGN